MKLDSMLTIPSIRTMLDEWLISSSFGGKQKFQNLHAIKQLELQILKLMDFNIHLEIAFNIITDSAEAIIKEIYNL